MKPLVPFLCLSVIGICVGAAPFSPMERLRVYEWKPPLVTSELDEDKKSVSSVGDVDGDGIDDLGVGEYQRVIDQNSYHGRIQIYSGQTGHRLAVYSSDQLSKTASNFGYAMVGLGNVNGNSQTYEIAVSAPGVGTGGAIPFNTGALYILSYDRSLSPFHEDFDPFTRLTEIARKGTPPQSRLGLSMALGDLNGSGVKDGLVVGAPQDVQELSGDAGDIYIFDVSSVTSNADIADPFIIVAPDAAVAHCHWFGYSVDVIPDINGDGADEIVAGEPNGTVGPGQTCAGTQSRVHVFSGKPAFETGSRVSLRTITETAHFAQGSFGRSVVSLGDLNGITGDGYSIAIGSPVEGVLRVVRVTSSSSTEELEVSPYTNVYADLGDVFPFGSPDGVKDVIAGQIAGGIALIDGATGSFVRNWESESLPGPDRWSNSFTVFDAENDGIPEIVGAGEDTVTAFRIDEAIPGVNANLLVGDPPALPLNNDIYSTTYDMRISAPNYPGHFFWLFGSAFGVAPGFPFDQVTVPLNPTGAYFNLSLTNSPPIFFGLLDGNGEAIVPLNVPGTFSLEDVHLLFRNGLNHSVVIGLGFPVEASNPISMVMMGAAGN